MFVALLSEKKASVDLSVIHTDGSHAPCTRGGEIKKITNQKSLNLNELIKKINFEI